MGDLIHTLPALTDAQQALGHIQFDWVADQTFAEIPRWHPAVNRVIISAHRQWKKNWHSRQTRKSFLLFIKQLREHSYDLIIDAQSSLKSALITRLSRGLYAGLDGRTVKEYGAHWFYQKRVRISRKQHHIQHLRQLFAALLNYSLPQEAPHFNLKIASSMLPNLPKKFIVFVPNASRDNKLWPITYWQTLGDLIGPLGFTILLPWGNITEKLRAQAIARNKSFFQVLPSLSLTQLAQVILRSQGLVCVDTGLSHLAAALGKSAITLYGPTNPELIGTFGEQQVQLTGTINCSRCSRKECHYKGATLYKPACLAQIHPEQVLEKLKILLEK